MSNSEALIDLNNPELWVSDEAFLTVWNTLHPWFEKQGYILYPRDPMNPDLAVPGSEDVYTHEKRCSGYPFVPTLHDEEHNRSFSVLVGLWPAVDLEHRDVIIKITINDHDESKIARMLTTDWAKSNPNNLVVPILDVLRYDETFGFIVMPRWSSLSSIRRARFDSLKTSFLFVKNMLQALTFLHENGIAHCDIAPKNILVNFNGRTSQFPPRSIDTLEKWEPRFVLCDFNVSVLFPPNTPHSQRVLPVENSNWGTSEYHPRDGQGEDANATYDPFAFDVACMGGVLCEIMNTTTEQVPLLAPFLDRMITPDITYRFTAAQALKALIELTVTLSDDVLGAWPPQFIPSVAWEKIDRWHGLTDAFVTEHAGPHGPVRPSSKRVSMNSDGHLVAHWVD